MIGNKYLIDTNIIVEIFKGNKIIAEKLNKLSEFYISAIVLGELFVGTNRVINKDAHLKRLTDLLLFTKVFLIDNITSKIYGKIVADLFKKGKPIPLNDIWIAATTFQHELVLITSDSHFTEIDDLKVKYW